jgi:CRISPR-associated protein Cst2
MNRGDSNQYSYISRQALRYNMIQQLGWDTTPIERQKKVVQYHPDATIKDYPEIDLFGYMKTSAKTENEKGGASTRSAVVRLSNAVSLEPYKGDMDFLTNMGLAARGKEPNTIAQSEIHASYYSYSIAVDLDLVGIDGDINIPNAEKADRINKLLDTILYLYRDIKGRRENMTPIFAIGGIYDRKNPFFENRIKVRNNQIVLAPLEEIINGSDELKTNTHVGLTAGLFNNSDEIKSLLNATTVADLFKMIQKEVEEYYG